MKKFMLRIQYLADSRPVFTVEYPATFVDGTPELSFEVIDATEAALLMTLLNHVVNNVVIKPR